MLMHPTVFAGFLFILFGVLVRMPSTSTDRPQRNFIKASGWTQTEVTLLKKKKKRCFSSVSPACHSKATVHEGKSEDEKRIL